MPIQQGDFCVIFPRVDIGGGTRLGNYVLIRSDTRVGTDCTIGSHCDIEGEVAIGNRVSLQSFCYITRGVVIEDDVFCGPSMVFTNVMNPRSAVSRKEEYMTTRVRRGATIGANATIICGSTLGEYAFVGAGAVVKGDIPPYAMVVGVPARIAGWMSQHGERLNFGTGDEAVCPATGQRYRRVAKDRIELVEP